MGLVQYCPLFQGTYLLVLSQASYKSQVQNEGAVLTQAFLTIKVDKFDILAKLISNLLWGFDDPNAI